MTPPMLALDDQQQAARDWFESLRDRICAAFEEIEREAGSDAAFAYTPWDRTDASGEPGGGGVRVSRATWGTLQTCPTTGRSGFFLATREDNE